VVNLDRKGGVKLPAPPPLEVDLKCPKCGAAMNLRRGKRGPWLSCSTYPKCRGRLAWKGLKPDKRKELELALMNHEKAHPQPTLRTLDGKPIAPGETPREVESP
jgi:DNA topoisomerase-1